MLFTCGKYINILVLNKTNFLFFRTTNLYIKNKNIGLLALVNLKPKTPSLK